MAKVARANHEYSDLLAMPIWYNSELVNGKTTDQTKSCGEEQ